MERIGLLGLATKLSYAKALNTRERTTKWSAIMIFVVLHALLTIALRVEAIMTDVDNPCISSTQVCMTEMVKLFLAFLACLFFDARGSVSTLLSQLEKAFVEEGSDMLKLCVPAILYTVQNNLQYIIETSPLFVIMYDCKVITTALFYTHMLNRRFKKRQWSSIVALTMGIGMVQSAETDVHYHHASNFVGISAVVFACITSGFAGVFFEKTMKDSTSSIWMINLELSMISSSLGMFTCLMEDTEDISRRGFFSGYDQWVVLVIVLQALAGLSIALVVKFADNVYKGFAAGLSLIIACFIDQLIFTNQVWTSYSIFGVVLIIVSFAYFAFVTHASAGEREVGGTGMGSSSPAPKGLSTGGSMASGAASSTKAGELDNAEDGNGKGLTATTTPIARPRGVEHKADKIAAAEAPNQSPSRKSEDAADESVADEKEHAPRSHVVIQAASRVADVIAGWFSEKDYKGRARLASKAQPD
jgi:UDP-sugar transporter A1/2/3